MSKSKTKSDRKRLKRLEKRLSSLEENPHPGQLETAALVDYKLSEFVRLGGILSMPSMPNQMAAWLPPVASPVASSVVFAVIATFSDLLKEIDRIKGKIQAALDTLQPFNPGSPTEPITPPPPPTPGTQKMREAMRKLGEAKAAAENLEPETAREKLKQAKDLMKHRDVRTEFRRIRQARSWYDILEELQRSIDYLDGILK